MAAHAIPAAFDAVIDRRVARTRVLVDYWELTKPEINLLVAITAATGFWMAAAAPLAHFPWMLFFQSVLGTTLVATGAATLNQVIELRHDARMHRTARRPIVSGRIARSHALWFGVWLSAAGLAYLAIATTVLAALLAALTLLTYLFVYTPLKRVTPLCTLVGAIPGAAPVLIGWAAARGQLEPAAWSLFAIVFLWQFPHFMSIAWMYREDYQRAGFRILPRGEQNKVRFVMWHALVAAAMLLVVSLSPAVTRLSGGVYFGGAFALTEILVYFSAKFALQRTSIAARQLLLVSILYLPALFALLVLDKT